MAILQLVDQLAEMLERGRELPLSRYRMIDADEFGQLIERMRISVPSSIRESERTLSERDSILEEAHAEAEHIIRQAQQRAMELVSQESIVNLARQEADRIVAESQQRARQRAEEADQYAAQVLQDLSERLKALSRQVDNGLKIMTQQANGTEAAEREPANADATPHDDMAD